MFLFILLFSIIIDLVSKQTASIFLWEKISLIWDVLFLKYVENTGIAFSIELPFLKILTIILIISIFYYYFSYERFKKNILLEIAFWLILWGAIWNWIERVLNGYVIDFIGIKNFAIFNAADIFINIWVIIYLYVIWKDKPTASDSLVIEKDYLS